jgi:hypothetical protein
VVLRVKRRLAAGADPKKLTVRAYRAVPNGVESSGLTAHDWVTLSKRYAVTHGESRFGPGEYRIIEQDVPVRHLFWDGNSIYEWGYDPSNEVRFARRGSGGGKRLPSMAEARRGVPEDLRDRLEKVWDTVNAGKGNPWARFYFDKPSKRLVDEIKRATGKDFSIDNQIITLGHIRHINKRHGVDGEIKSQVPVTKEVFAVIPDALKNFDTVEKSGKASRGDDVVKIKKRYSDGTMIIADAVLRKNDAQRPNHADLEIRTVYIDKSGKGKASTLNYNSLAGRTGVWGTNPADSDNIGDSRQKVNRESKKSFGANDASAGDDFTPLSEKQWNKLLARLKKTGLAKEVITDAAEMRRALEKYGKDAAARFMNVWHGSPHAFDRFSLDYMGTGQGDQIHGWGLYFTNDQDMAKAYSNIDGDNPQRYKITIHGTTFYSDKMSGEYPRHIKLLLRAAQESNNKADVISYIEEVLRHDLFSLDYTMQLKSKNAYYINSLKKDIVAAKKALAYIANKDVAVEEHGTRDLYLTKVYGDKTEDDINFLNWDEPITDKQRTAILNLADTMEIKQINNSSGDIYQELKEDFHSARAASEFLYRAGIVGTKHRYTNDLFEYVVFDDKALEIVEHIRFMSTPNGEVYGFATKDGKIYLDPEKMNANTPVHEYGHLWIDLVRENNKPLYNKLMGAVGQTDVFREVRVDPAYAHLKPRERHEEVVARAIASVGEGMFTKKEERAGAVERLMEALRELWEWVMEKLGTGDGAGLLGMSAEDMDRLTFGEIAEGAARELLGGRRVKESGENYIRGEGLEGQGEQEGTGKEDKRVKVIHVDVSKLADSNGNAINITSARALRQWLIKHYGGREVVVSHNKRTIRFTKKGLLDSLKRRGTEQRQAYADLDGLLESSIYDGFEAGDERHPHIDRQEIYYAAAKIGEKTYGIRFKTDIKKGQDVGTYKDHKVVEIDGVEEIDIKEPPSPYRGVDSPRGIEGGKSITVAKIKEAMGLTDNITSPAPKSK